MAGPPSPSTPPPSSKENHTSTPLPPSSPKTSPSLPPTPSSLGFKNTPKNNSPLKPTTTPCASSTGVYPPPYVPPSKLIPPATTILTQQFPSPPHSLLSPSTLALVSLLHDIGTAPSFLSTTQLSFEFAGALVARDLLLHASPPSPHQNTPSSPPSPSPTHSIPLSTQSQTEAIIETIIRHQDIGTTGTITFLGQLIQLATLYDNIGGNPGLVHADTKVDVNRAFPRAGWSGCFAATVREEMRLKPWAHSTHLGEEEFPAGVEGNALMREFDAWE